MRFPVQQKLKLQDQYQFEKDLIQQDIDLLINFRNLLKNITETQRENDIKMRNTLMQAQDNIATRIYTFPLPVNKLDKIELPED